MSKFGKFMEKKKVGPEMDDVEKSAKMTAIKSMKDKALQDLSGKLKTGMSKVTVAADSPDKLKLGLEKAKELIAGGPGAMDPSALGGEEESSEEEMTETPEMEASEHETLPENMTEEEIDAKLEELMKLKAQKSAKSPFYKT